MTERTLKVLAIIEASSVSGPAKNLLEFCRISRSVNELFQAPVHIRVAAATFDRGTSASILATRDLTPAAQIEGKPAGNAFLEAARAAHIRVHQISERFRFDTKIERGLRQVVEFEEPDIIQTHGVKSHFLIRYCGLWRNYRWLAFHHGYTATDAKMLAYNQLDRFSLKAAGRVVTVCEAMARDLIARGISRDKISVLHNSVNAAEAGLFHDGSEVTLRRSLGIGPDERVVLSVGRLSREKGHADLIPAIADLKKSYRSHKVKLAVVGDGPERLRLEQAADEYGLKHDAIFVGHIANVLPYYKIADVFALPSLSEGSPNVLLEAMAARTPVVATAVGGVPEIITSGVNGLLVAPRDGTAMASAIKRVLQNSRLRQTLIDSAVDTIIRHHSPEARVLSLTKIYAELAEDLSLQADPLLQESIL
jgi:glycosyltransferase involved in cell wall biosynthesis